MNVLPVFPFEQKENGMMRGMVMDSKAIDASSGFNAMKKIRNYFSM